MQDGWLTAPDKTGFWEFKGYYAEDLDNLDSDKEPVETYYESIEWVKYNDQLIDKMFYEVFNEPFYSHELVGEWRFINETI